MVYAGVVLSMYFVHVGHKFNRVRPMIQIPKDNDATISEHNAIT